MIVRATIPMPPSVNKAYTVIRGRKVLSTEGRRYKRQVRMAFIADIPARAIYNLHLLFYFEKVFNSPDAQEPVREIDVSNRVKLAEDAISEALGVDDRYFFRLEIEKREGTPERVEVVIVQRVGALA